MHSSKTATAAERLHTACPRTPAVAEAAVSDGVFVEFAELAAAVCQAPRAVISLADGIDAWSGGDMQGAALRAVTACTLRGTGGAALGTVTVFHTAEGELSVRQHAHLQSLCGRIAAHIEVSGRCAELELFAARPAPPAMPPRLAASMDPALALAMMESASVVIYHSNVEGNLTYANPEYRRIFGLRPEQSTNDWVHGVHPEDRDRMADAWDDFCRRPRPVRFEYRTQPAGGELRYFCEQVVPIQGAAGYVGTISDFTDLVSARDDLHKAENLFLHTFDQAPIGIAYADRGGRFLRCNDSFCALLGFTAEELTGKSVLEVTHAEDAARTSGALDKLWSGGLVCVDHERRYLRSDGGEVWVRATIALIRDAHSEPECSVEFLRDITDLKQADLELERVHKALMSASRQAGMAEVATNVLHNVGNILNSVNISASLVVDRLKQSKGPGVSRVAALLKDQGDGLGAFVAADERGRRIPDYLEMLGGQLIADQQAVLAELASLRENLEHIKETVSMQQSYARLCGVTERVEVADLVEDALRLNAGAFARHGVTLSRDFAQVPAIVVDKHKVLQILVNLVRNAKYACDESGRSDKLLTLRVGRCPNGVSIAVVDNGIGIPPENMPHLFTHGFTTRQSGHGFGLHSGALAAQELGGSLHAESAGRGLGAAFILDLPLLPQELQDA